MKRPHRLISYKGDIENSDSSVWVETSQISTRIASCDIDQYWKISQEFELLQWDGFKDISVASKVAKYYGKKYPKRKYDTSLNFTISKWWLLLFIYWSTHVVVVLQNIRRRFPPRFDCVISPWKIFGADRLKICASWLSFDPSTAPSRSTQSSVNYILVSPLFVEFFWFDEPGFFKYFYSSTNDAVNWVKFGKV